MVLPQRRRERLHVTFLDHDVNIRERWQPARRSLGKNRKPRRTDGGVRDAQRGSGGGVAVTCYARAARADTEADGEMNTKLKKYKKALARTHTYKKQYIYICIYQNKTLQRTIYSSHINAVAAPPLAADRSVCSAERPIEKPLSLERRRGPQTHRTNTTGVQRRGGGGRGAPAGWGGAYRDQSVGVEGDRGKNWKLNSSPVVNLVVNLRTFVVARAWVETGVGTTLLRCWSTLWDTQRGRTQETEVSED